MTVKFIKLEEAAIRSKKSAETLLEQGAVGKIGIYVVPSPTWKLRVVGTQKIDFPDGGEGGYFIDECLTGLPLSMLRLRLPAETLSAFIHYQDTTPVELFLFESDKVDVTIFGMLPSGDGPLLVKDCSLVVRESDLPGKRSPPVREAKEIVPAPIAQQAPEPVTTRQPRESPMLLSIKEVADRIGFSESTVRTYVKKGLFPKSVQYGPRTVRWKVEDVQAWVEGQRPEEQ